jgi:hypothetical protein
MVVKLYGVSTPATAVMQVAIQKQPNVEMIGLDVMLLASQSLVVFVRQKANATATQ